MSAEFGLRRRRVTQQDVELFLQFGAPVVSCNSLARTRVSFMHQTKSPCHEMVCFKVTEILPACFLLCYVASSELLVLR